MANVKVDFSGLRDFAKQLNAIPTDSMCKEAVTQLGAVYIASAKRNTPVKGNQSIEIKQKDGSTERITSSSEHMRRSWQMGNVEKRGRTYRIKVSNTASYATFVDKGHRQTPGRFVPILGKKLVGNYVKGFKITDKAEKAVKKAQGRVFKNVIDKHTREVIKVDIIKELTSLINEITLLTLAIIILKLVSKD